MHVVLTSYLHPPPPLFQHADNIARVYAHAIAMLVTIIILIINNNITSTSTSTNNNYEYPTYCMPPLFFQHADNIARVYAHAIAMLLIIIINNNI